MRFDSPDVDSAYIDSAYSWCRLCALVCGLLWGVILWGCDSREILDPEQPNIAGFFQRSGAQTALQPVPDRVLKLLEGVYTTGQQPTNPMNAPQPPTQPNAGVRLLGNDVVGKISGRYFSLFSGTNRYMVLKAGMQRDSAIVLYGYWRSANSVDEAQIAAVQMTIAADSGGKALLRGIVPTNPAFRTLRGGIEGLPPNANNTLELTFSRPLVPDTARTFLIVAHRAGWHDDVRTHSENSLKALRMIEQIGANAAEIDIRMTKDSVAVLFHDAELTTREVVGDFAIGPIENYTLAQLRALCTYRDGEPIPTLDSALEVVVRETTLEYLWLDVKTPALVNRIIPKLQTLQRRLQNMPERRLTVWFGLGYADVNAEFIKHPAHRSIASIVDNVEGSTDEVETTGAVAWSSRWTLGTRRNEILAGQFRQRGVKVIYWTLNLEDILRPFIQDRSCDGVITDRPYLATYLYHTNTRPRP